MLSRWSDLALNGRIAQHLIGCHENRFPFQIKHFGPNVGNFVNNYRFP